MVGRDFCRGCGQERMVHNGVCCDCRDYARSRDKSFLTMFLFVLIAGSVIVAFLTTSQVYFD
jgi:hypothetical protein